MAGTEKQMMTTHAIGNARARAGLQARSIELAGAALIETGSFPADTPMVAPGEANTRLDDCGLRIGHRSATRVLPRASALVINLKIVRAIGVDFRADEVIE